VATQVLRRLKVPMRIGGWDLPSEGMPVVLDRRVA